MYINSVTSYNKTASDVRFEIPPSYMFRCLKVAATSYVLETILLLRYCLSSKLVHNFYDVRALYIDQSWRRPPPNPRPGGELT